MGAHIQHVAHLYRSVTPGETIRGPGLRTQGEDSLLAASLDFRKVASRLANNLGRRRPISIETGWPKGSIAHAYYVSLHDPQNSTGPTTGFYPVFLLSTDLATCWLSVLLAAASEGISGRGGWSQRAGQRLRTRAALLAQGVTPPDGWITGAIRLGPNGSSLWTTQGSRLAVARAYECGSITARSFSVEAPPSDLDDWLLQAFALYDQAFAREADYLESALPSPSDREDWEQRNAVLLGRTAETYFLEWCLRHRREWGAPRDRTQSVGLGYDVEFPDADLVVEVKGFRGPIDSARLTPREWHEAEKRRQKFVLCLVTNLDSGSPQVTEIRDPFTKLSTAAQKAIRKQISIILPKRALTAV